MQTRRDMLKTTLTAAIAAPAFWHEAAWAAETPAPLRSGLPEGLGTVAVLEPPSPGKKPLIKLSYRPPNYETPKAYFDTVFTPNDAFFVRYHLAGVPTEAELKDWRLKLGGDGAEGTLDLGLDDLRKFEPVELAAVCQCSGNRRGLSTPHVAGVEWGDGAMGNARWKGARLKDVLAKLGIKKEAVELIISGADGPVLEQTPKFVKSLPVWKALDENVLIAYEMNGGPLPLLNGYPARLVVPGWTGVYWLKHVNSLQLSTTSLDNFWMRTAYRIPQGKFPAIERFVGQENAQTMPITEMVVNSLITAPADGAKLPLGSPVEVKGVAWDAGYGIRTVEVSGDAGQNWQPAQLGEDAGRFSFRPWSLKLALAKPGTYTILAKATNKAGETQVDELIFNPAGYHNNVVQRATVTVS